MSSILTVPAQLLLSGSLPFYFILLSLSAVAFVIAKSQHNIAPSPRGKAQDFDSCIHWFDSSRGCYAVIDKLGKSNSRAALQVRVLLTAL